MCCIIPSGDILVLLQILLLQDVDKIFGFLGAHLSRVIDDFTSGGIRLLGLVQRSTWIVHECDELRRLERLLCYTKNEGL